MALKHVEKIRTAVRHQQVTALSRLRNYVSMLDGNQEAVDLLRGSSGDIILAETTEFILRKLGHDPKAFNHSGKDTPVESSASVIRRQISRVRAKGDVDIEVEE